MSKSRLPEYGAATHPHDAVRAWVESQDEAAAAWLVRRYQPLVAAVVQSRFRDPGLVEDLVQCVFIKCFRALHRVHDGGHVAPWIARIASNTCANAWRDQNKVCVLTASEAGIEDLDALQTPDVGDAGHQQKESRRFVASLLRQVGKRDRKLLWWHYFRGSSAQDTGSRFGISSGNVRVRLCRMQKTLASHGRMLREEAA